MKVPYTQQFTPKVTPLHKLIPILRSNAGDARKLKTAIAGAFFSGSPDPSKMAGNTLIALRNCGILEGDDLTDLGQQLLNSQSNVDEAHRILARHFLLHLDGISIVETIREMQSGGDKIDLTTLPAKLRECGFTDVSENSSDLSGVLNWLREAKVLSNKYAIDQTAYYSLVGTSPTLFGLLQELTTNQVAFLKSMAALNVTGWTPHMDIVEHAEALHPGEVKFNHKQVPKEICEPLQAAGFIEYQKKQKVDTKTPAGRGGKTGDVRPSTRFENEVGKPLIDALYRAAGFNQIRRIRGMSLDDIVADVKQTRDTDKQGKALEYLSVRLCQMLELQFMGWRETDPKIAGGGEVDAMFYSARLIYSRWQVQCKIGEISMGTVAKEKGMQEITLANVILIVSTGPATDGAKTFRTQVIAKTNLHIIFIDGAALERIIKNNTALIEILRQQAETAIHEKPSPQGLRLPRPSSSSGSGSTPAPAAPVPAGKTPAPSSGDPTLFSPAYSTELGQMFCGNSFEILPALIQQGIRAKLIVTSPPFALVKKKEYGNEDAESYVRWFDPFIDLFKQVLEPNGSLVIDIGGAWIKGLPIKSIYQYKLLVRLCESGFYLAQEFYHYNPAKLPTPAEWVTIRRLRVKDAVNNVFWLTLDPFADADNRRILTEYSDSMKALLKNGYKAKLRPSGHNISTEFGRDNGGAIPPNLLQFSNTESNSAYMQRCRDEGIKPHPARFPLVLPEFFIKFLTRPGDLVLDPLAGSNSTGAAAEQLGRRWIGIEENLTYVEGSALRFKASPEPAEPVTTPAMTDVVKPREELSLFTTT
jgi:DNA modification methylase